MYPRIPKTFRIQIFFLKIFFFFLLDHMHIQQVLGGQHSSVLYRESKNTHFCVIATITWSFVLTGIALLCIILKRKGKTIINCTIRRRQIVDNLPETPGTGVGRDLASTVQPLSRLSHPWLPGFLPAPLNFGNAHKAELQATCTHSLLPYFLGVGNRGWRWRDHHTRSSEVSNAPGEGCYAPLVHLPAEGRQKSVDYLLWDGLTFLL